MVAQSPSSNDSNAPHVIELNAPPPTGSGFKLPKKAFIFGLVTTLLLAITAIVIGYFYIQQRTTVDPQANQRYNPVECRNDIEIVVESRSSFTEPSNLAFIKGKAINNCDKPVDFYMLRFWCSGVKDTHTCGENRQDDIIQQIAPGQTYQFDVSMPIGPVGQNANCGSSQVDVRYSPNPPNTEAGWPANEGGLAWGEPCGEAVACTSLSLSVVSPLQVKATVTGSGTFDKYRVDFGDGNIKESTNKATNILDNTYSAGGTYTVKAYVLKADGTAVGGDGACQKPITVEQQVEYDYRVCQNNACGPTQKCPTPGVDCRPNISNKCTTDAQCAQTFKRNVCENNACVSKDCPTPGVDCSRSDDCKQNSDCGITQTYKHNICQNNACVSVDCSPNTSPCSSSCSSNADCAPSQPQTHRQCVNQACQVVAGAGADTCTSDVSCRPAATPPPIPQTGSTEMTIGAILIGAGVVALGALFAL